MKNIYANINKNKHPPRMVLERWHQTLFKTSMDLSWESRDCLNTLFMPMESMVQQLDHARVMRIESVRRQHVGPHINIFESWNAEPAEQWYSL